MVRSQLEFNYQEDSLISRVLDLSVLMTCKPLMWAVLQDTLHFEIVVALDPVEILKTIETTISPD